MGVVCKGCPLPSLPGKERTYSARNGDSYPSIAPTRLSQSQRVALETASRSPNQTNCFPHALIFMDPLDTLGVLPGSEDRGAMELCPSLVSRNVVPLHAFGLGGGPANWSDWLRSSNYLSTSQYPLLVENPKPDS